MDPTTDVAKQHKHETKTTTKLLPSKTPATATRYVSVRYTACSLPSISEGIDREYGDSVRDRETFFERYKDYLKGKPIVDDRKFMDKVFEEYTRNTAITPSRRKNVIRNTIEYEKVQRMEEIRSGKKRYKRTPQPNKIITKKKGKKARVRTFKILATTKGKKVFTRKIKTKKGYRYVTKEGYRAKKI